MDSRINIAASPVTVALIFICEKCGKKIARGDDNPSRDLQQDLKALIKERGGKGKIRAAISSCIDVCPRNAIAVAIMDASAHEAVGPSTNQYLLLERYTPDAAAKILAHVGKKP